MKRVNMALVHVKKGDGGKFNRLMFSSTPFMESRIKLVMKLAPEIEQRW